MQTASTSDVVIEVCGRPTPPGWMTEPARLLEALTRVEVGGWPVVPAAPAAGPPHTGASLVALAIVLVRLAVGFRSIGDLADRRARMARRLHDLADAAVHRGPSAFLPASLGGRFRVHRRAPDVPGAATPDAGGIEGASPGAVRAAGATRAPRGEAIVIPLRRGPSADAVPVDLPPHVAAMMARIRDTRTQQRAHATYVRAERTPAVGTAERPPHPADALRDALRARRAAAGGDPGRSGGTDRHSWVVDD